MAVTLDLADIQGNILASYGKLGYPFARLMLFSVDGADAASRAENGRRFVELLRPRVTTALRWDDKPGPADERVVKRPDVALNIAFTYPGLVALGVSTRTLQAMPDPYVDGMAKRARILGDDFSGARWREKWDEVWQDDSRPAHILVTLNARGSMRSKMAELSTEIVETGRRCGVKLLDGHNQKGAKRKPFQDLTVLFKRDMNGDLTDEPTHTEHFGFTDGISDPVFEGQYLFGETQLQARGNGAVDGEGKWRPLATGEFLLGYPDEAQETSGPITPISFFRNGTFMAYRKLHENVRSWKTFIDKAARDYQKVAKMEKFDEARELLIAKMIGRWSNGVPMSKAPTTDAKRAFDNEYGPKQAELKALEKTQGADPARIRQLKTELQLAYSDFSYSDDLDGIKCPLASHARRANTRDGLDPRPNAAHPISRGGSIINNRRRILRRGLTYGDMEIEPTDDGEHGIVMLAVCADLFRQFEFVQQQWMNYGLDARAGSDTCPIAGNHSQCEDTPDEEARRRNGPKTKFVAPADPNGGCPPFIVEGIPQFVETRGGDYFFVPSLTALRLIAQGAVDPT